MAAAGGAPVRLRLHFDFPPPGSPGCALCWLLLEPGHARLVTDLVSLIRHRFGFSRRARLSLFLEGALLPPTESARLVRDNDALRVKLEEIAGEEEEEESGSTAKWDRERRKRRRKDEGFSRKEEKRHKREKKKKKRSPERSSWREETSADVSDSRRKQKKRKRAEGTGEQSPAGPCRVVTAEGTATTRTAQPQHGEGGSGSSSSTDSDSTEPGVQHGAQHRAQHRAQPSTQHKPRTAAALSQDRAPSAAGMHGRGAGSARGSDAASTAKAAGGADAQESSSSSSDSDSSSGVEAAAPAQSSTAQALPRSTAAAQSGARGAPTARSSSSSSSESDSADPQTPAATKPPANAALSNPAASSSCRQPPSSAPGAPASPGRGRGRGAAEGSFWRAPRGRGFRGAMRGRGWGRAGGPGFCNYSSEGPKQGLFRGTVTKASVPVQNAVEVPKRDYSVLPLLAAPPQVGERIAFKRLELTENYSPEVSDYKEGRIISWNAEKNQIELEILSSSASPIAKEPGKFDLVYQSADGAELIEYAVPQDTKITESWDALIEPRLIVEPPVNGSGIENGTA